MPKGKGGFTVLLVEDEIIIALDESSGLKQLGHHVICAHGGDEALGVIRNAVNIDVVLMDIDLGTEADGIDYAKKILEIKDLPIVFLTSHDEIEIIEKAGSVSSYGFISKNTGIAIISTSMRIAVKLFKQNRELLEQHNQLSIANKRLEIANLELERNERKILDREDLVHSIEKKYRDIMDIFPDYIFIYDSTEKFLDFHIPHDDHKYRKIYSSSIGKKLNEIIPPWLYALTKPYIEKSRASGGIEIMEYEYHEGPVARFLECRILLSGGHIYMIVRDITARKLAEKMYVDNDRRYKVFLENFQGIAFQGVLGHGLVFIHGAVEEITGYSEAELTSEGRPWTRIINGEDLPEFFNKLDSLRAEFGRIVKHEYRITRKDGTERWIHVTVHNITEKKEGPVHIQGMALDITERRKMEESFRISRMMLSQTERLSKTGSFEVNFNTGDIHWSDEMYLIVNRKYADGPLMLDDVISTYIMEDGDGLKEKFYDLRREGVSINEVVKVSVLGDEKYMQLRAFPRRQENGTVTGMFGYCQDITRVRATEDSLKEALRVNVDLLRELQHRAKNSFSMVYSMIRLTAQSETSETLKEKLFEIANRIRAVSEMYDLLYKSDSVNEVELHSYLRRLTSSLPVSDEKIEIVAMLDSVTSSVKTAIPIGIIVVELMTNSIKHAFMDGEAGRIELFMSEDRDLLKLRVSDTGSGIADDYESWSSDALGIKLVRALVDNIGGNIEFNGKAGTSVYIDIPMASLAV